MPPIAPSPASGAPARRWIMSRRADLAIVLAPLALAVLTLPAAGLDGRAIPLWAFLIIIVAFDVAHVWGTLYLSYLDTEIRKSRPLLFWLPIPLAFLIAFRLHEHSSVLYWTLLAYVAIYHFIMQQWGFIALYKSRAQERNSFDYYLDKWTLWVGALGPVLVWHATPARQFDWFNAGESFIFRVDAAFRPDIFGGMAFFALLYLARQAQHWIKRRTFNAGKNLWMIASWISWSVGIGLASHPLISAAFLNLLHGIPFLVLVWFRCNKRFEGKSGGPSPLLAWLSQKRNWLFAYGLILALALVEELLWDGQVWRVYLPGLLDMELAETSSTTVSFWVALLSVPQVVHYFLDAWIWKLNGSNPDLKNIGV